MSENSSESIPKLLTIEPLFAHLTALVAACAFVGSIYVKNLVCDSPITSSAYRLFRE